MKSDEFFWPSNLLSVRRPISNSSNVFKIGSSLTVPTVALLSKILTKLNYFTVHNHQVFLDSLAKHRLQKKPFISISNHSSCIDDPILWGALFPWKWICNPIKHRWSAAAHDVCFTKNFHTIFFAFGKTFPIVRGKGIYQPAMDFAVELLKEYQFLHVFPQGKVVQESDLDDQNINIITKANYNELSLTCKEDENKSYCFKWGIARLILDLITDTQSIEVLPFYHLGMDKVLPNIKPYIPQIGKKVTVYIRKEGPILFNRNFIDNILCNGDTSLSTKERRIAITKFLEEETKKLKWKAIEKHFSLSHL